MVLCDVIASRAQDIDLQWLLNTYPYTKELVVVRCRNCGRYSPTPSVPQGSRTWCTILTTWARKLIALGMIAMVVHLQQGAHLSLFSILVVPTPSLLPVEEIATTWVRSFLLPRLSRINEGQEGRRSENCLSLVSLLG